MPRPTLGNGSMSPAERQRLRRERLKATRPPKPEPRTDAEQKRIERERRRVQDLLDGKIPKKEWTRGDKELVNGERLKERRARAAADQLVERDSNGNWSIEQCCFRNWAIPSASVDLILTDPPYASEYLPLYQELPFHAHRWLKNGGWCMVMVGQRHLPAVLSALAAGPLDYAWTLCLEANGGTTGIHFLKVQSVWKPVIILRKGAPQFREWTLDILRYRWTPDDGDHHKWQQELAPFIKLIRAATDPGTMIADPFVGSGTTGLAALATGRSFVGCDLDAEAVATARLRLSDGLSAP